MKFPIIVLKENEAPVYFFDNSNFGLVSKGGESFYKNGVIYDSEGSSFLISGIDSVNKATLLKSVIYFQQMYIAKVKFTPTGNLTISEVKEIILNHIQTFPKYWIQKDLIDSLSASILNKSDFSELYRYIK